MDQVAPRYGARDPNHCMEQMAQPPKPDAFLSYKTDDGSQFTDKLEDALTKQGITVWRDKNSMQPGDDLFDEIADGIDNCSVFIALITPGYASSKGEMWCRREYKFAVKLEKKIIPVVWSNVKRSVSMQFLMGSSTLYQPYCPENDNKVEIIEKICSTVRSAVHGKKRVREPTNEEVDGALAQKRSASESRKLLIVFPGQLSQERFLRTQKSSKEHPNVFFFSTSLHVTTAVARNSTDFWLLMKDNFTCAIILLPLLIHALKGSCYLAKFCNCSATGSSCTVQPPDLIPSPNDGSYYIVEASECSGIAQIHIDRSAVPPMSGTQQQGDIRILAVCIEDLDKYQHQDQIKELFEPGNEELASSLSMAANELLRSVEKKSDIPSALTELTTTVGTFLTPPYTPPSSSSLIAAASQEQAGYNAVTITVHDYPE